MLERLKTLRPDWQLCVLCRDPRHDAALFSGFGSTGAELFADVSRRSNKAKVFSRLMNYVLWSATGRPRLDLPGQRFTEACDRADVLVFCGGGSPGGYGMANLLLHAVVPVLMARRLNLRIVFTGLGMEKIQNRMHRSLMRWVLNQADAIGVRDPMAGQTIREMGVESPVTITADWAFGLSATLPEDIASSLRARSVASTQQFIGLNLRADNAGGPERETRESLSYRILLQQVVTLLLERTSATVFVVSMTKTNKTDDYAFALSVGQALPQQLQKRFVVFQPELSPKVVKGIIGSMSIFIGTRLHPTIFAVSECVPTLAVHDLRKVSGFMEYCGLAEWFVPLENTTPETIVNKAMRLFDEHGKVKEQLRARVPTLRNAIDGNIKLIEDQLARHGHNVADAYTPHMAEIEN
jgi:polysaccharide pyruvyl transferase WcaK-like protein